MRICLPPIRDHSPAIRLLGRQQHASPPDAQRAAALRLSDAAHGLGGSAAIAPWLLATLRSYDIIRQEPEVRTYVLGPGLPTWACLPCGTWIWLTCTSHPRRSGHPTGRVRPCRLEGDNVRHVSSGEGPQQLRFAPARCSLRIPVPWGVRCSQISDQTTSRRCSTSSRRGTNDVAALEVQPAQIREFVYALIARPDDITSSALTALGAPQCTRPAGRPVRRSRDRSRPPSSFTLRLRRLGSATRRNAKPMRMPARQDCQAGIICVRRAQRTARPACRSRARW